MNARIENKQTMEFVYRMTISAYSVIADLGVIIFSLLTPLAVII